MSVLGAERIKLFSTKSPWWSSLATVVFVVGFGMIFLLTTASLVREDGPAVPFRVGVSTTQQGIFFGQMVILVMAALAITTEYRFNTIKTTFQAIPGRTSVMLSKALIIGLLAAVLGEIAAFASWGLGRLLVTDFDLTIRTADQWRQVAGAGLVFAITAIIGLAVGALTRHTAGAVTALLVWAMLGEQLIGAIPRVGDKIQPWLPFNAGGHFLGVGPNQNEGAQTGTDLPYNAWGAVAYFAGVAVVLFLVAVLVVNRRDA
ncbi:ABC transporter permease [Longimycelium tulufanense]|uniref:ABC transporter permease n=1 Tax=Longimycelium tulufanense TaxID=907463 RepID=A0A8J3FY00_9PSEU|nr:ABC transporter permease [Longimycelium tulufanense]GGM67342.1 ABC transporter permease [Longimycelium tulufanense]